MLGLSFLCAYIAAIDRLCGLDWDVRLHELNLHCLSYLIAVQSPWRIFCSCVAMWFCRFGAESRSFSTQVWDRLLWRSASASTGDRTDRIQLPLVTESNTSEVRRGVPEKKHCGNDRFRKANWAGKKVALWCLLGEAELAVAALLFVFTCCSISVRRGAGWGPWWRLTPKDLLKIYQMTSIKRTWLHKTRFYVDQSAIGLSNKMLGITMRRKVFAYN